jgi:phage terminase small subunit
LKTRISAPADLDREGKKKFRELIEIVDPDIDRELVANYCRQFSSLAAIRREKAAQIKAGTFQTMTPGRDKTLQLNPLLTAEGRLIASQNKALRTLGLAQDREGQERQKKKHLPTPAPPGHRGPEPSWGWEIETKICGGKA